MSNAAITKDNRRNRFGVKASSELYRTIKGAHHVCWISYPSEDRVAAYRAAGIRCARRGVELFVHHMDTDDALRVDAAEEQRRKASGLPPEF